MLLAVCSVGCWALILEKTVRLTMLKAQVRKLANQAAAGRLTFDGNGLVGAVDAGRAKRMGGGLFARGERAPSCARASSAPCVCAMKRELKRIEFGLPFLATVGSASPFVGLLGTVWGIMHSFTSIAQAKDTSLAVVAPGIAEALFATALGLAAAIPAVVAYNQISVSLGRSADKANASITTLAKAVARGQSEGTVRLEGVG